MSDKKRIDIFDEDSTPSTEGAAAQAADVPVEGAAEDLSERLAALEAELAAAREAHLRSVADLQNFRRRVNEERAVQLQFANEGLISEVLPVLDNFERATGCEVDTDAARNLLRGVCMVEQQFRDILTRFGVQRIVTLGQFFDPAQHEAVERVVTEEVCEGTIVGEVEPGYALNGRVIRPARVKVAVAPH
ncbi:MAG: nucleotide exchange factor GrpE [Armatimonadota bacterium]